jgi:predicted nuclease of restriction endonuclease-like RecB superfamily
MLTKDLLEVTKYRPNINPVYREIDDYEAVAEEVIDAYQAGVTRGEIDDAVSELETHDTFKLVRGLSKLLDRRSTFEQESPAEPTHVRAAAFDRGYVTSRAERETVLTDIAEEFDISIDEAEASLWADREEHELLVTAPDTSGTDLLKQYNLSLTQTLLFDALELEFTASENYQQIFGLMSYLGLMYTVDSDLTVTVTGPAALFKKTRKYGTTLARLVPSIMQADEWSLSAQVETEVSNERRVYEFSVDSSQASLFPETTETESFDSEVERDFAVRIKALADGWTVSREPTILRTNERVMIPDFSFERDGEEFYLEVIGFWTPEYLQEKIEKVRAVESEQPLVLAVNEQLNCTKEDFEGADEVFFYDGKIPVKPVVTRLNVIEDELVRDDLETLREREVALPDEAIDIEELASEEAVEPAAMQQYLDESYPGIISGGTYLPEAVIQELKGEIESLESQSLSAVNPLLEEYGVAQDLLGHIGYSVQYVSLNQDEAKITKS